MYSLQVKVFALVVGLLLAIQGLTLFILYQRMHADAAQELQQRLIQGRGIFFNQFSLRNESLAVYANTLAKDYGLMAAFHEGRRSLLYALMARQQRVGADLAIAVDLHQGILADTADPKQHGKLALASSGVQPDSGYFKDGAKLYQMAGAPIDSPVHIGTIYFGFRLDDALARRLADATGLQVTFMAKSDGRWQPLASSLPPRALADLRMVSTNALPVTNGLLSLNGDRYAGLDVALSPATASVQPVSALLLTSQQAVVAHYQTWWNQILGISAVALLLALAGAWLLARHIVRPVRMLLQQAGNIAAGDSAAPISLHQRGELGELVNEFNRMQAAVSEREAALRYHTEHDRVTDLGNRYSFEKRVAEELCKPAAGNQRFAVLILDLDRFKDINDSLGYDAGDRLLREVGKRLDAIRETDEHVARVGGDEFAMVLCDITIENLPVRLAQISETLAKRHAFEGLTLRVTAGIGVAIYPDHGRDVSTLLRHADMAKGTAKDRKMTYAIYDGSQDRYSLLRLSLLAEMQNALAQNQLLLHYQPKLDLSKGGVCGAEALIRWEHPAYGRIPPAEFIPLVEQTGNISFITQWALRTALEQIAAWKKAGLAMCVAINVSPTDLHNANFADELEELLTLYKCKPSLLELEITERAVVEDVEQMTAAFRRLRTLGLTLSIDDYGTGYSSMAQLKRLPVDTLKIDQSFVVNMDRNGEDEIIVRSIVDLGHKLGLTVVGEGVESRAGLEMLRKFGCDSVQGHYISQSLSPHQFEKWWQSKAWQRFH